MADHPDLHGQGVRATRASRDAGKGAATGPAQTGATIFQTRRKLDLCAPLSSSPQDTTTKIRPRP